MSLKQDKPAKGILLVLLSSVMFSTYGVWSKLIGSSMGALYQGWTRGLILSLVLIPLLYFRKELTRINRTDFKWLLVFLIFTSATQAPIYYAYNHMDIGTATLLFYVSILITTYIVGFFFLNEKMTKVKLLSFLLALLGLYTIFSFSLEKFTLLAALMAVFNGIASGGEVSFSKKLTGNYSSLYVSLLSWLIVIPTNGLLSIAFGEQQIMPSFQTFWFWQLCYTAVSFFGFWFVMAGFKYIEASIGGLIGLLEIIFSIVLGIVLFKETLTTRVVIGAILILAASSLPHAVNLFKNKK